MIPTLTHAGQNDDVPTASFPGFLHGVSQVLDSTRGYTHVRRRPVKVPVKDSKRSRRHPGKLQIGEVRNLREVVQCI